MEEINVIGLNSAKISASPKFLKWVRQSNLENLKIYEEWSYFSPKGQLVFALFRIAGRFVFFHSDAVAVFLVVRDKRSRRKYVVLVEQLRVPTGGNLLEIPAGTIEDDGNPAETAAREIKEETGLEITADDLQSIGTYYSSPGACSEKITIFYCVINLSGSEINSLSDRLAGLREEGESTLVRLLPLKALEGLNIADAKTQLAYELCRRKMEEIIEL